MHRKYDHQIIEKKWQSYWEKNKTFKAGDCSSKPKYYVLDMFPYPSGAGLHVGHVAGYTGTDIVSRYMRQKGYEVLHPMGWDSFGLPAEQYAIRTGTHPKITTKKNIEIYKRQLKIIGFSYDWDREISTSDSSYYKWTQWIFTKLYEKGLAYEAKINVNYCPILKTILANEEVEDGKSKEGGYPVERVPLKQWILKITAYAERLIEDLDKVDWPENIKKLQVNWIGKSEGAKIKFKSAHQNEYIEVFTTRPDTIFGATYLVLSPEHPLVSKLTTKESRDSVKKYIKQISLKSDLERTDLAKEKTGVFIGSYAINPANGKELPIWIADYVLTGYGTGAIMAVPAHDERDFEFENKFSIPIICVYDPDLSNAEEETPLKELKELILTGKRCWTHEGRGVNSENDQVSLNGLEVDKAKDTILKWLEDTKNGTKAISYKLRDWLFSRQRYWGEPIPILNFKDGTRRFLDLDELPLLPPELDDYKPEVQGQSPLAKVDSWVNILDKKTNKKAARETNTMPQWAGSCWYYLRFIDPKNDDEAWNKEKEKYWMPVDLYVGGAEHAVLHLLYSRFWHKVLFDIGLVHTDEPYKKYRYQGLLTAPSYRLADGGSYVPSEEVVFENEKYYYNGKEVLKQIEKMSKSKLNGVTPDEMVEEFGADALRLYEMFMGPFDKEKIWNTDAVSGCKRFLNRFYDLLNFDKITEEENEEALKLSHKLLYQVTNEIENMQFNTAIAHLMEFLNAFSKLEKYSKNSLKIAIQMLYPFAPHIGEEMNEILGFFTSLTFEPLQKVNEKFLIPDSITYIIQVNGKLRARLDLPQNVEEEMLINLAKQNETVKKYIEGEIIKSIFVPNKLINFVVKQVNV
ncbi:MAG: leucine--tRNA ligase [Chlamydiae bacterium RIFCSPHIGHO2_12_FULL_27_8]|nr:MAG: leucine--tRNA ligase [Chlamydiae bacterium RIFCSPHIGHO2_12_FULL_27_8]